jgi:DNA-directed RNA polymerase specialized sigma24 family protein
MIVAGELPAPGPTTYERVLEAVKADPAVNPSELAATLGVSRNTVYAAIHRARKQQLRESGELQRERRCPD